MRDIRKLYAENSSTELLNKLNNTDELNKVISGFGFYDPSTKWDFGVTENEYDCYYMPRGSTLKYYYFTDYSFIVKYHEPGESFSKIEDRSDEWVTYLIERLQGEYKDKYIKGLQEFSDKISQAFKQDVLKSVSLAKPCNNPYWMIDLQPERRLIEQQIEQGKQNSTTIDDKVEIIVKANMKHYNELVKKGKTIVIKPEISKEEIEQALESVKKHDTEHGQLL